MARHGFDVSWTTAACYGRAGSAANPALVCCWYRALGKSTAWLTKWSRPARWLPLAASAWLSLQISETEDLCVALSRHFAPGNPLQERLSSGRCFVRFATVADTAQRKAACKALNQLVSHRGRNSYGHHYRPARSIGPHLQAGNPPNVRDRQRSAIAASWFLVSRETGNTRVQRLFVPCVSAVQHRLHVKRI